MPEWSAEIEIDAARARRLIAGQFPELAGESLERFGEGWDNTLWLVGGRLLFRFPRRAIAVACLERELAALPVLGPLVDLPVPTSAYRGEPGEGYPWPFFGTPLLPGVEASEAVLGEARREVGLQVARFLRSLHRPEVLAAVAPVGLPVDPNARADMQQRAPRALLHLDRVAQAGLWEAPAWVEDLCAAATALAPSADLVVVHGDLHFRHLLVEDGRLTGVVDWGDVCLGCRSIDLQLYWSFIPAEERPAFLSAYGPVDEGDLLRARVLALSLNALLAVYGYDTRRAAVAREAIASLERTVESGAH